ncbi:hypothetical protein JG688_00005641 [Phytophthora aleatoria]|uniref:EF-hand domain-containing protein n=1 Tax=Phytophthora aleatoria TaxID=2496075 RepID=A0A8J5JCQ2_9STRA|nr:hypothetical protein JG688_00005641 [Phytophthora aleatoria]
MMLRSPGIPKSDDKHKMMKKRQILSASISADALLGHEQQQASRRPIEFAITDILPKKIESSLPTSPTTLGPLSVPRPIKNVANGAELIPPAAPKAIKKGLPSPVPASKSLESYAERLEQAENTELFTYASALCHRVTGRYLPRTLLQSDPEAQQRELERIQRDPEILRAIDSVRVLSAQFKDVAQTTMGHRRELGHTLFRIEESYLKLFEKLLELSLRLYWEYKQRTEAQRKEDRASIERWREKYERKCVEHVKLSKKLAAREIIHRTREIELQDFQGQTREIEKELGNQRELETQIFQLQNAAALQRVLEQKLRDDFNHLTKTHEEMVEYQKQLKEEVGFSLEAWLGHKQLVQDLRRTVQEKEKFISKQEVTLRQLEEIVSVARVTYESHSSQTEVDDDGLWDVQDGIPRFVSKSVVHKMMWRRFNAFVACKNCGGRPLPKAAKTNPFGTSTQDDNSEEIDIWSVDKGKKRTKKAAKRLERIEQLWWVFCRVYYVHKVLKLLMDALEQRHEGIKKDLSELFDSGDVNHDCVLTLDEFSAIIRKRKPHFSDRRILRMFRESLMGGADQSFALSMEAFVVVCNDHGLVSLLPDDRMVDPFAVPHSTPEARQRSKESSIKSPQQDQDTALPTTDTVNLHTEIPEDITRDDDSLPSARAQEVDEEEDTGWQDSDL